jgi:hypothetical protein
MSGDGHSSWQQALQQLGFIQATANQDDAVRRALLAFQRRYRLPTTGTADEQSQQVLSILTGTGAADKGDGADAVFMVRGQVSQSTGEVPAGVRVQVQDRGLRDSALLGESGLDESGRYEVRYTAAQVLRQHATYADVRVRAIDEKGAEIATSPTIFHARRVEVVDVDLSAGDLGPSEYEVLTAQLSPALQGASLEEPTDGDVTFLSNDRGIATARIALLRESAQAAMERGLPVEKICGCMRTAITMKYLLRGQSSSIAIETTLSARAEVLLRPVVARSRHRWSLVTWASLLG